MSTNRITLSRDGRGWHATFTGPHAKEINDLFGTDTIPTAYTAAADAERVMAGIRSANPGVDVVFAGGGA